MSETPVVETVTEPVAKVEVPAHVRPIVDLLKTLISSANDLGLRVKSAKGNEDEKVSEALTASTDPEVVSWREWDTAQRAKIAAAQQKINENRAAMIAKVKESGALATIDVDALTKEFLSAREAVKSTKTTLGLLLKPAGLEYDAVAKSENFPDEIQSARGSSGKVSQGGHKPRLATAQIDNGEVIEKPTFTTLAKSLDVDLDTLKKAAFEAAGTDDLFTKVGEEITFTVVSKGDKKSHSVTIVPRTDAKVSTPEVSTEA